MGDEVKYYRKWHFCSEENDEQPKSFELYANNYDPMIGGVWFAKIRKNNKFGSGVFFVHTTEKCPFCRLELK